MELTVRPDIVVEVVEVVEVDGEGLCDIFFLRETLLFRFSALRGVMPGLV
jgi:hypothetical protein